MCTEREAARRAYLCGMTLRFGATQGGVLTTFALQGVSIASLVSRTISVTEGGR
jgi:hypothetical protein